MSMRIIPSLALGLTFAVSLACTPDEEGPKTCTADYDCDVGNVCGADGLCAAAAAGATRNFGKVSLDFTDTDATYLLGVFTQPIEAEAPAETVLYTLSAGGGTANALRLRSAPRPVHHDPVMQARIAFERERREMINALVDDLRAGRRSLASAQSRQSSCATDCGAQMCWEGACTDAPTLAFHDKSALACDLLEVVSEGGLEVNVLIDATVLDSTVRNDAIAAATAFAESFGRELALLGLSGHSGALDRDGDGRLNVVFTDKTSAGLSTGVVGFFDLFDFLPPSDSRATGNESDILWSRVPGTVNIGGPITAELAVGTLVHEYTHLARYAQRVHAAGNEAQREVVWLDEASAHVMEDLTGWGGSNITVARAALDGWDRGGLMTSVDDDETLQRGRGYLLLRYMIDRAGRAAGANGAGASAVFTAAGQLLGKWLTGSSLGYLHGDFDADTVWESTVASFATHNTDVTDPAADAFAFLNVGAHPDTNTDTGINPFGSFTDARGDSVDLAGISADDLTDLSNPLEDEDVLQTGSRLYLVTGMTGPVDITGSGDAQVDFKLRAVRVR